MNVLLITLDQFRADMVDHALVATPSLDRLRVSGVHFARHFAQAAPCAPGRASLYTGMYQANHRVVGNGTPLDHRFDNVARLARRAGMTPVLFGYTDQGIDPRMATGPDDPRLEDYSGVLPGFDLGLWMPDSQAPWLAWLEDLGYGTFPNYIAALAAEPDRPSIHSLSTFVTDAFLEWHERQDAPWFAHLSHLRPHPPYAAAGEFATMYDPADVGDSLAPAPEADRHHLHELTMGLDVCAAPATEAERRHMRTQYFGMVSEVDAQVGRVLDQLEHMGQMDDTLIILTSDHGEQLGDHGLREKLGFFPESYAIGCIVHDPRSPQAHGTRVDHFTENIDILPTIAVALGVDIPVQVDGLPLQPFLAGEEPEWWRTAAHWEWDWRAMVLGFMAPGWPLDRRLERMNLAVVCDADGAYVHFGDGTWLFFDLRADQTWRTTSQEPARVLTYAQAMLGWRQEHLERTMTDLLLEPGRPGRWPAIGSALDG